MSVLRQSIFLLFILFIQKTYCEIDPPIIVSATVFDTYSVLLSWSTNNSIVNPTRYRILLSRDNWNTSQEWPTQMERVQYSSSSSSYDIINSISNFECFNKCLQKADCVFASRLSEATNNCYLFKDIEMDNSTEPDAEYIRIIDYANSTILRDIPYNDLIQFKVAIFDSKTNSWTPFSKASFNIDFRINLALNFQRTGWNTSRVFWSQNKYTINRFTFINVTMNSTSSTNPINDVTLKSYEPGINYCNENYSSVNMFESIEQCENSCFDEVNCVQYTYFNADYILPNGTTVVKKGSCFLRDSIDIVNGVRTRREAKTFSVISTLTESKIDNLVINGNYRVKVDCKTLTGSPCLSNIAIYNVTNLAPVFSQATLTGNNITLRWRMPEPVDFKRFAFCYSFNDSSKIQYALTYSQNDYDDANQQIISLSDINKCFEKCFELTTCEAFTFNNTHCMLKFNLTVPKSCSINNTCVILPSKQNSIYYQVYYNTMYHHQAVAQTLWGFNTPYSDSFNIQSSYDFTVEQIDQFYIHSYISRIRALINPADTVSIEWFKDGAPLNLTALNAVIMWNDTIYFYNVTLKVGGVYHCEIVLKTGQRFVSKNYLNIIVNGSKPLRPTIKSLIPVTFSDYDDGIVLKWDVDVEGLPITCLNLYTTIWSQESLKYICDESLQGGVLIYKETFDCDTQFSIELQNSFGFSDRSGIARFDSNSCEAKEISSKKYYVPFVACTIVISCLALGFLVFSVILIYKRKYQSSSDVFPLIQKYSKH